jgi:hypothetical protein
MSVYELMLKLNRTVDRLDSRCLAVQHSLGAEEGVVKHPTGAEGRGFLGFQNMERLNPGLAKPDLERVENKLKLDFFNDLCTARMNTVLCVLSDCIKRMISSMTGHYDSDRLRILETYMNTYIYNQNPKPVDMKIQITKNTNEEVYLVMINGQNDSDLMYCAKRYKFPRGCPVLWKPREFVDFRGFYPKFDNDAKKQDIFDYSLLEGAVKLSFFKKWSGFLLHVIAWKNGGGEYRWTVATKKNADYDNKYNEMGRELVSDLIKHHGHGFIESLATERLYLGGEAMHTKDEHAYIARRNALVVTCIGSGLYADLTCAQPIAEPITEEYQPLMQYKDVNGVAEFCKAHGLGYDSAVTVDSGLREFVMDGLLEHRDTLTNRDVDMILESDKFPGLSVLKGTADHSAIAGNVLEGFVFNLEYEGKSKYTTKVKLPHYTWKTMFLRTWLKKVRNMDVVSSVGAEDDVPPESLVNLHFDAAGVEAKIDEFVRIWCCTSDGRKYFKKLLKSAVVLVRSNWVRDLVEKTPGVNLTNRVHVKLGEYVETLPTTELDRLAGQFYSSPNMDIDAPPISIWVCLGPIGAGKSSLASLLGRFVNEKIGPSLVEVIDADLVVNPDFVLRLKSERNPATKTSLWSAISRGRIPIISAGGGQFCRNISEDTADFALKDDVARIFGRRCELVVFFPERCESEFKEATGELLPLEPGDVDPFIHRLYPSADRPDVKTMSASAERFKAKHPSSVAQPRQLDSYYMELYEVMSDRIRDGKWAVETRGRETAEALYHRCTLDVYTKSFGNRRFALQIANAADYVFRLPYVATDEVAEFNARVVSCGRNLNLLRPLVTPKDMLPCRFEQVRALMANEEGEIKHVTLGYGSGIAITPEKWDEMDKIKECAFEGSRFYMDLKKVGDANFTSTIMVDKLSDELSQLMFQTDRYPHVTISYDTFRPADSVCIIPWLEQATLGSDSVGDFYLSDARGTNFVFLQVNLKQDAMVARTNPKTGAPIMKGSVPVTCKEKGNCSAGQEKVRYTCIGISAGLHSDWSVGGGARRK